MYPLFLLEGSMTRQHSDKEFSQTFKQLVKSYTAQQIDRQDYLQRRKKLLDEVELHINAMRYSNRTVARQPVTQQSVIQQPTTQQNETKVSESELPVENTVSIQSQEILDVSTNESIASVTSDDSEKEILQSHHTDKSVQNKKQYMKKSRADFKFNSTIFMK